jgi:hypothetical protein
MIAPTTIPKITELTVTSRYAPLAVARRGRPEGADGGGGGGVLDMSRSIQARE